MTTSSPAAGRTRDEDFPGGGYLFAPDGSCAQQTPDWSEGMLYATVSLEDARRLMPPG